MYREDEDFKKAIKALSELLRRERDISRVETLEELMAKKKAISLVVSWVNDIFKVDMKVEEPYSGIEDLFVYKSDTSARD